MKKSRFTDEQIAFALKQAETGTRIDEICRKMGISDATFYKWRQKYGGLTPRQMLQAMQLGAHLSVHGTALGAQIFETLN